MERCIKGKKRLKGKKKEKYKGTLTRGGRISRPQSAGKRSYHKRAWTSK